jgi:hypothetical protein
MRKQVVLILFSFITSIYVQISWLVYLPEIKLLVAGCRPPSAGCVSSAA